MGAMERVHAWRHQASYLLIVLAAFGLRLVGLGAQSLWYDETVSVYLARQDIPSLVAHTARDIHPPGYYILLHLWSQLAGDSEFALAYFSLVFGVLVVPLTYAVARHLFDRRVALWSALLVSVSAYGVWYSQEVRMYTLAAALGLLAIWSASAMVRERLPAGLVYVVCAAFGLYVLYYYAFLLVVLNLVMAVALLRRQAFGALRAWLLAQAVVLLLYAPWLPVAWRQATEPPVPPWRAAAPLVQILGETWTALSFGQSVQPGQVWPLLLVVGLLLLIGLGRPLVTSPSAPRGERQCPHSHSVVIPSGGTALPNPTLLLLTCTFGPLALICLVSWVTPIYHVRYMFTYAAPFCILLGSGLAWLMRRARPAALLGVAVMLGGTSYSIYQMHTDPSYAADDLRGAVRFVAQRWRPGDAVLINAGYAYTGFLYYYRDPLAGLMRLAEYGSPPVARGPLVLQTGIIGGDVHLGWDEPDSDFYATTQVETDAALSRVFQDFPRLWMLRIYDTVADPGGSIRRWLTTNAMLFEDRTFAGPSYVHVQGYMSPRQPAPPSAAPVPLEGDMTLVGWQLAHRVRSGDPLDVALWWQVTGMLPSQSSPYAVSVKLWGQDSARGGVFLAAQEDEWPIGSKMLTPAWPLWALMRHPVRLDLPSDLAPGAYWLEVQLYDSATVQPFGRLDGQGNTIALGSLTIADRQ